MRFFKRVWYFVSVLAILFIMANFTMWFIHNKAIKNLLLSVQGQLAEKGLGLSYDDTIFNTLTAWHVSGKVKNVEIYATNANNATPNSLYVNVGDVEVDSNWFEHKFIATFPSEIPVLIKFTTAFKTEEAIPLKFTTPDAIKVIANLDFYIQMGDRGSFFDIINIYSKLNELIVKKDNDDMVSIKGVSCDFNKSADNEASKNKQSDNSKDQVLTQSKLDKMANEYHEWLLDVALDQIELSDIAKKKLSQYSSYLDKMGIASFSTKIGRIANLDKSSEDLSENFNLGYRVNNFVVSSEFFSIRAYGDYFGRINDKDKLTNYVDMSLNIRNYNNVIDFYTDLMNKFITTYQSGEVFSQKEISSLKQVIPKIWKVDNDYLKLRLLQDGGNEMQISGYTKDQILDMARKEANK